MLELVYPGWLLLLPLPLLLRLLPAFKHSRDSIKVPFFDKLLTLSEQKPDTGAVVLNRTRIQASLVVFSWLCLVLAASKPEWVGEPVEREKSARDLMVAVDLSGSMQAEDFSTSKGKTIDRLEAVKLVLREFAEQRSSDRLGLIVFGNAPYLQVPFTDDHQIWKDLLDETEIGMAGQSTVFGDAIGLAIHLFQKAETENRVLIVLTDGNDTGSKVPPVEAAKVARAHTIKIYTIAIGDPLTLGEEALDLDVLGRVAELTGGAYFQAIDREQLLAAYQAIATLEPELYDTVSFRPRHSIHHLPIALSVVLYMVYHLLAGLLSQSRGVTSA